VPAVENLIFTNDDTILENSLLTLFVILDSCDPEIYPKLLPHLCLHRICQFLTNKNLQIAWTSLEIINIVCSKPEFSVEEFIQSGGLLMLKEALKLETHKNLYRIICMVLSNIMVGPYTHIQKVFDSGLISIIIGLAIKSEDFGVRKEAIWAICNAMIHGNISLKIRLIHEGALEPIVNGLSSDDANLLMILLDAVDKILELDDEQDEEFDIRISEQFEALGGISKLEELQLFKNDEVYKSVQKLLEKRFRVEEVNPNGIPEKSKNDNENSNNTK